MTTSDSSARLAVGTAAACALVASYVVAAQDPIPEFELHTTQWINDAPDAVAWVLYPVMQLGTVWAPLVAGVVVAFVAPKDRLRGAVTAVTGVTAWFAAKGVKAIVERGRPLQYLPGIDVREGAGTGLGYVSGHAAVAAATAVMITGVLPARWRWVPIVLAAAVGISRVVFGVHLVADVVGGWAVGTLLGLVGLVTVDALQHRRSA